MEVEIKNVAVILLTIVGLLLVGIPIMLVVGSSVTASAYKTVQTSDLGNTSSKITGLLDSSVEATQNLLSQFYSLISVVGIGLGIVMLFVAGKYVKEYFDGFAGKKNEGSIF